MRSIGSFFARLLSFSSKEFVEVPRQPKLILALILGPFLILLLFGIVYTNQRPPERTMLVISQDNHFIDQIESKAAELDYAIEYMGITDDFDLMMRNLNRNAIDLGVVIPDDVYETIRSNQQAVIETHHNQIDPAQITHNGIYGILPCSCDKTANSPAGR